MALPLTRAGTGRARRAGRGLGLAGILRVAWRAILGNPLRSMLTALGVIIGVAAVIALTALGTGSTQGVTKNLESLGTNLLTVGSQRGRPGGSLVRGGPAPTVTLADANAIAAQFGSRLLGIAPADQRSVQAKVAGTNAQVTVVGTWPAYAVIRNAAPDQGSFFTQDDLDRRRKVAVIGFQVAQDLYGDSAAALGQTIRLDNLVFRVIGVEPDKGATGFQSPNAQVFIPLTVYAQRFSRGTAVRGSPTVSSISLGGADPRDLTALQQDVTDLVAQRHDTPDPGSYDFTIQNQADALSSLQSTTATLTLLVGAIAGISLLVGGIGIMNIMLVSVTERTREIGVRKALGARPGDILTQFLVEASVLSVGGGVIGVLLGIGLAFLGTLAGITPVFTAPPIVAAFVFSALVGVFFGYYPAARAARLDPVESLRYE
ncbi:ABC transporter permease [Deinococcus aquiradiocola]|uniref:ABC transporter permease n=1 Tax=Deinococcus aquiradiocola TaxID=393059 RepID=A0A917PC93_9DEIO|nr:ABC transporter permease [Deinococcus aquiradiocola]GGJ70577.1 ABC transporter permease [Deinococcus aquiradiocola]